jgi:general stress protein YciG
MLQVEAIFKHLLTVVGKMFRRVATSFAITFVAAAAITEAVASVLTKQFPPDSLTHVTAVIIGFGWGLVVALAVAIEEGLRGFIGLIEEVAKATEQAAVKLGQEIGKEGGQLVRGVEHEAQQLASGAGRVVQSVERGTVTAVKDVAGVPGRVIGGIEGGVERLTGRDNTTQQ